VRRDPSPFYRVDGTLSAREKNHVEVQSDSTGVRVLLNGKETLFPGIGLLDFGETGFMAYDQPVTLTAIRVEPTAARAAKERSFPALGALLPLLFTAAVWFLLRFSGGGGVLAAAAGLSAFYPVAFYLSAALLLGRENLLFLGDDRFLSQDLLLTAAAISLLFPVVLFRRSLRGAALLYNLSLIGAFLALALFFWDRLPAEHRLKLKFNREAVAPGELVGKKEGRRSWHSDSRSIGSNNFMWKQQLGGRPLTPDKPEGTIRIFVLGGSQAWGSGAASSRETYDALLERKMRARGLPVEIFNGGINGAGISKVNKFFRNPLARYSPDILIVDIGLNDSAAIMSVRGEKRALRHMEILVSHFEELIDLCEKQGVLAVLVLEPMSRETPLRPNREFYERIAEIARERAAVIDAGPVMRELETDHFVWWDTAHLALYGHQTLAALLEPVVAELAEGRPRGSSD
jgi:lysophospholipase L1-like esterase